MNWWYRLVANKLLIKISKLGWSLSVKDQTILTLKHEISDLKQKLDTALLDITAKKARSVLAEALDRYNIESRKRIYSSSIASDNKHGLSWLHECMGDKIPVCKCGSGKPWYLCVETK